MERRLNESKRTGIGRPFPALCRAAAVGLASCLLALAGCGRGPADSAAPAATATVLETEDTSDADVLAADYEEWEARQSPSVRTASRRDLERLSGILHGAGALGSGAALREAGSILDRLRGRVESGKPSKGMGRLVGVFRALARICRGEDGSQGKLARILLMRKVIRKLKEGRSERPAP